MARGAISMSKKGAIVKKLSAIPDFGGLDVLCTDKTGTLTEGKIALVKNVDLFGNTSDEVLRLAYFNSYFQTGIENSLDDAVLDYRDISVEQAKKIEEIPFDFTRKRLSVVVEYCGDNILVTKGAPEEIFSCSTSFCRGNVFENLDEELRQKAWQMYQDLSREGYRVLAVAVKKMDKSQKTFSKDDEKDLAICGFIGFLDPPKAGTKETIDSLEAAGIEVKVITGDNELVAQKICEEIDLPIKGVILGSEMDRLTDEALSRRVEVTTIFARFSPEQKNRIILALKSNRHVVGYMGDGINDAPSLKTADVGISVNNAVDVAKESADIILTKKNLDILRDGVVEGRKVFANTMKYIQMGLSSNFGNMFSAAGAVVFLPFLPMLPLQILLNNFIYDVSQVTIPIDNVDKELTLRPRRWDMRFVRSYMIVFGLISSIFDFLTFFVLYSVFRLQESAFQTGWFLESLATQILVIHIIRTRKIPFIESRPNMWLLFSTVTALVISWIIPYTPIALFFGLIPLPPTVLIAIFGIVIIYLFVVEIGKRCFYKFGKF
jgi:Mg2+-importing ATPase